MADVSRRMPRLRGGRAQGRQVMMSYESARERQTVLMVMHDAVLSGNTSALPALRRQLPSRDWNHAPYISHARECHARTNSYSKCTCTPVDTGAIELNASASLSCERSVIMINPTERAAHTNRYHRGYGAYVLWFGGCGATYLHVYASGLEDAIEQCAAWLADYMPGHIMTEWGEDHTALVREACEDAGLAYPPPKGADMEPYWEAKQSAEADLTRTESGFLTSYEWGLALEQPTTEALYAFVWGL